jgi:acetyltransferase-like isoleucine patch superfamily enzyme
MSVASRLQSIIKSWKKKIDLYGHNEYTIAEYFRKQGAQIGSNSRILVHDLGSEPFLIKIGDNCTIAPDVCFINHDASAGLFRGEIPNLNVFGKIEIKANCFIGYGAIILYDVTIGSNSIVGAGSVVTKDVPPNSVVAGVPARVISSTEEYKKKCIKRWELLGLKGSRKEWQEQLVRHFWGEPTAGAR